MHVLTVATDLDNAFLRLLLIPSCAQQGLRLVILRPGSWRGFISKRAAVEGYLATLHNPDELVLFTDAYDTVVVRGEDDLVSRYHDCGHAVLFSGDTNCWPLGTIGLGLYGPRTRGRFAYLNSGGYLGPAAELARLLGRYQEPPAERFELLRTLESHGYDLREKFGWSDQYYWTLVHLLEPSTVGIDRDARVFEYLGPSLGDFSLPQIRAREQEFKRHGRASPLYQEEATRVRAALASPSAAAQLHFAGLITKHVLADLLQDGALPAWLLERVRKTGPDTATAIDVS